MYPLSKKDKPPKMNFINVSGKFHNTIHRMDYGFWEEVDAVIQREPLQGLDPEIRGMLASIGIEKGKPFKTRFTHEEDSDRSGQCRCSHGPCLDGSSARPTALFLPG